MTGPLEADIEGVFVKYAESVGCPALKLRIDGANGFPDRTILTPKGVLFFEFKTPKGKLRPMQKVWRKLLIDLGYQIHTPRSSAEAIELLDNFLKGEEP